MAAIRNGDELRRVGEARSRDAVLRLTDTTLRHLDAYRRLRGIVHLDGDVLRVGSRCWDLSTKDNVYLVGAGKAANAMAMAIDHTLGDRLTRGIVIVKTHEDGDCFARTEVHVGGHPLPDEAGLYASRLILDLADRAGPNDLFLAVVSGGSSALMNCPAEGITVDDERAATDVLLKSGADIRAINAVRRHISQTNGGRLAQRIAASGAELVGFGISDAVGNPPTGDIAVPRDDYAGTPIGPDPTTLADAGRVVRDYALADRLPPRVLAHLRGADETPKAFPRNTYFVINTVPDSVLYAQRAAREHGIDAHVLTAQLEGESRDAGTVLAAIARDIHEFGRPFRPPCFLLSAGETTTRIDGDAAGHGGPAQELAAAFALAARTIPGACLLAIDSEGTDGTTPAAGALVDSSTAARADDAGLDLRAALRGHATFEALTAVGDIVVTGNTGTNLCDFNVLYIPGPA